MSGPRSGQVHLARGRRLGGPQLGRADQDHRRSTATQYAARHAAQQRAHQAGPTVGSHDDQVNGPQGKLLGDPGGRRYVRDARLDPEPAAGEHRLERVQVSLRLLDRLGLRWAWSPSPGGADWPSLIIAYSHSIAHGYDLRYGLEQQKKAVPSGHWPLYRFDPRTGQFMLDSRAPSLPLEEYLYAETRYRRLVQSRPEEARRLLDLARAAETPLVDTPRGASPARPMR